MTAWSVDERRRRWQQAVVAKQEAGLFIERDPRFVGWIEEWIAGDISMVEVQRRYAELRQSR